MPSPRTIRTTTRGAVPGTKPRPKRDAAGGDDRSTNRLISGIVFGTLALWLVAGGVGVHALFTASRGGSEYASGRGVDKDTASFIAALWSFGRNTDNSGDAVRSGCHGLFAWGRNSGSGGKVLMNEENDACRSMNDMANGKFRF